MRPILLKLKPTSGFSSYLHRALVLVLPIGIYVLVSLNKQGFVQVALSIIVLSKWRMFAVKPRFWAANVRANAIDLMVGLSVVVFMTHSSSDPIRFGWAILYAVWLIVIKPASDILMVTTQAFIGQLCALMALYLAWASGPVYGLTLLTGLFCYLAARHFLEGFDEPYAKLLAYVWGYFGAALAWLTSHWLLFYPHNSSSGISLPTLLLSCLGYGFAGIYYFDHNNKLNKGLKQQLLFVMLAIVILILAFSDWGDKVV
jgi:hypothetical protein